MKLSIALAVATAGLSTVGTAQTVRDLDSHEHGSATLNVAVDTNALFLELETPWNNLVGFEHEPGTDEQWQRVREAWALLNQPEQLFTLSGGNCTISDVRAETVMPIEQDDAEHEDDKHEHEHEEKAHEDHHNHDDDGQGDDKHDDHADDKHDDHADDKHDDHADKDHDAHSEHDDEHHDHDEHAEETHSAALATYSYSCGDIAQLSSIDVNLFTLWSGFAELDVQLIGPGGQTATELNAGAASIDLSDVQ